eukprot:gene12188-biopygen3418
MAGTGIDTFNAPPCTPAAGRRCEACPLTSRAHLVANKTPIVSIFGWRGPLVLQGKPSLPRLAADGVRYPGQGTTDWPLPMRTSVWYQCTAFLARRAVPQVLRLGKLANSAVQCKNVGKCIEGKCVPAYDYGMVTASTWVGPGANRVVLPPVA